MMARRENPFAAVAWLAGLIVLCAAIAFGGETDWNVFQSQPVVASADAGAWQLFESLPQSTSDGTPECVGWNVIPAPSPQLKLLSRFPSPCVLLFTSPGCPPCKEARGPLTKLLEERGWTVHQIDYDVEPDAFEALEVEAVPTFIAVRRTAECGRYSGVDRKELVKMLTEANNRDPK